MSLKWTWLLMIPGLLNVAAATEARPPAALSDSMSLEQVGAALAAHPPAWDNASARAPIFRSMDQRVKVRVWKEMTDEDRAAIKPLVAFYRQRVDVGLDALEATKLSEGIELFKFYSSSIVFKTRAGTVAVDFCQGPVNNGKEPEQADYHRGGFFMTPAQRDRLARLVDVSLMTHRHHDHSDYSLARRLLEAGKTVIGPAQLKTHWKDLADRLTVPAYGKVQRFGPVEILTMLGSQYSTNEPRADGRRYGVPTAGDPTRDSETVVYLFRLEGITFLQAAENHVPCDEFLRQARDQGWKVNVCMSAGQFQGARSARQALSDTFDLPLHEYEMTHHGAGNRTGHWLGDPSRIARKRSMPILWGEHFHLTAADIAWTR